jgi:hypothetical protein
MTALVKNQSEKSLKEHPQKVSNHPGTDWDYCTSLTKGVLRWNILLNKGCVLLGIIWHLTDCQEKVEPVDQSID